MVWSAPSVLVARTRCSRTSGGFTFIELVAVMVILAIMAITAVPALHSVAETRAAAAANHLLRDLGFARQYAQATGVRTWVVFEPAGDMWSLLVEDAANPGRAGAAQMNDPGTGREMVRQLAEEFGNVQLLTADIGGEQALGFDWLGRPLGSNEQPLTSPAEIALSGGHSVYVEVETGYARPG